MTVDNHFNQEDFIMYSKLEELVIQAATKTGYTQELQELIKFYGTDFNASDLETHLELLNQMKIEVSGEKLSFNGIHQHFNCQSSKIPTEKCIYGDSAVTHVLLVHSCKLTAWRSNHSSGPLIRAHNMF